MRSDSCHACSYPEPHSHGFACEKDCASCFPQRCQHCYGRLRALPSDTPGAPDRLFDQRGEPECGPGFAHKVMPRV